MGKGGGASKTPTTTILLLQSGGQKGRVQFTQGVREADGSPVVDLGGVALLEEENSPRGLPRCRNLSTPEYRVEEGGESGSI